MTPDQLSEIEARANAAKRLTGTYVTLMPDSEVRRVTLDLCEHAPRDIPALCAALREAWAERDKHRLAARVACELLEGQSDGIKKRDATIKLLEAERDALKAAGRDMLDMHELNGKRLNDLRDVRAAQMTCERMIDKYAHLFVQEGEAK